jgi:hypothetical protein
MPPLSAFRPGKIFSRDQTPFASVPSYIRALLETKEFVAYIHRVLIIGPTGESQNYLTVLRVHPANDLARWQPLGVVRFDRLILERDTVAPEDLFSEANLDSKLCSWARAGRLEAQATLSFFLERVPGRSTYGPSSCWRFAGIGSRSMILNNPLGPFFDHSNKLFFVDVQNAASWWTGSVKDSSPHVAENSYQIIIPDYRANFVEAAVRDAGLEVSIARRTEDPLSIVVAGIDFDGQPTQQIVDVPSGSGATGDIINVDVPFRDPLTSFKLFLVGESDTLYDEHTEAQFNALPGDLLLAPERSVRAQHVRSLTHARDQGEGLDVEFKEWIPKDRGNKKSAELLQTAVAFANARGGTIYIGVTDETDVVGLLAPLRREYGKDAGGAIDRLQTEYMSDLRERLLTLVKPRLDPAFQWIPIGHELLVLAISIPPGGIEPHYVEGTGEAFIRRSATNRRATPDDILQLVAARRGDAHGSIES